VHIILIVVLLPAPFNPKNAKRLLFSTEKLMPSTALMSPKLFFMSFISILIGIFSFLNFDY